MQRLVIEIGAHSRKGTREERQREVGYWIPVFNTHLIPKGMVLTFYSTVG